MATIPMNRIVHPKEGKGHDIMTNLIGGLQMVFGIFALNTAISLARAKIPPSVVPLLTPAPNSIFEITLITLGSAIVILAILQKLKHIRYAEFQVLPGLVIVAASAFLYLDSNTGYYYSPNSFWLVYLVLASGGLTAVAVLIQFFVGGLRNHPGY